MNTAPSDLSTHRWIRRIGALGLIAGVVAVLAMLLPGPLYRFGLLGLGAAFSGVFFGYWLGLLATLLGLIALLLALFVRPRRGRVRAADAVQAQGRLGAGDP